MPFPSNAPAPPPNALDEARRPPDQGQQPMMQPGAAGGRPPLHEQPLTERIASLSDEQKAALTPEALDALKIVLPQIAHVIDAVEDGVSQGGQDQGGDQEMMNERPAFGGGGGEAPPSPPQQQDDGEDGAAYMRPKTRLGGM